MEETNPGSITNENLQKIEEGLASNDGDEKQLATIQLNELLTIKHKGEVRIEEISAVDLVKETNLPAGRMEKMNQLAIKIDEEMERLGGKDRRTTQVEMKRLNEELELFASGLGVEGRAEVIEAMITKLDYMKELAATRESIKRGKNITSPLKAYREEFQPGVKGEILELRDVSVHKQEQYQTRLGKYKEDVRRELLSEDTKELEKLSPDELMQRMEEATYWQEHKQVLFGKKEWRGYKKMDELRDVLVLVEAQYTVEFERRMAEKLGASGVSDEYVRLATQRALKARKPRGRSKYNFEKGVTHGKSAYGVIEQEVRETSKKMETGVAKKRKMVMTGPERAQSGWVESGSNGEENFTSLDEVERWKRKVIETREDKIKTLGVIEEKLGVDLDDPDFLESLDDPETRKRLVEEAMSGGKLSEEEVSLCKSILDSVSGRVVDRMGMMGERFTGVQKELVCLSKEAHKTGNYAPYMIKLQAYIDRVGLRETSSDFQFAIVMRQAKDEISHLNADAGGKFDLWQEAQFVPSITSVDEETFYKIIPKLVTQARMQYELEDKYSNWLAMQVDGHDGKKALSVASFHQLLQREDVANRVLSAKVNGNDGLILQLWAEHVWGEGVTIVPDAKNSNLVSHVVLANGERIDKINVNYFLMDSQSQVDTKHPEEMNVREFLDQSMWMAHYAEKLWWYSGEWEPFFRDFPGERASQANKRLLSIGAAFRDYGLEYGKFNAGFVNEAKAGVLLQDFRTYKAKDVIVANVRHLLYDTKLESREPSAEQIPIANWKRGEKIGNTLFDAFSKRANISEEYRPRASLRPVEEIRLMGHLGEFGSEESRWDWYKNSQEKIGRKGVPSYGEILGWRKQPFESLREEAEAWVVQAEQNDQLFRDLTDQRKILDDLGLTAEELRPLMDKQTFIKSGSHRENGRESLDRFLRDFEYSSVLSYSELRKGTDPMDYQNYSNAKMKAAQLMPEVLKGIAPLEKRIELYGIMSSYMPPHEVVAWFTAVEKRRVQLRTFQWNKYDIAMTDLEEWQMRKKRGEEVGEKPPEAVIGFNPAVFKIRDERGDTWNVKGSDGFRVTRNRKTWRNHLLDTRDVPPLTPSQMELEHRLMVANGLLPNKEIAEEILESSFGISQLVDRICKDRGWDPKSKSAKKIKKYGSKAILLLRKHPLFDDPVWAFWNILNTLKEYGEEVGKEIVKEGVGINLK